MPGLKLLGYTQETSEVQTGAPIDVTLYWQSDAPLKDEPLTLQLTLVRLRESARDDDGA